MPITTVGMIMLQEALPPDIKPEYPVTKGSLGKLLKQIGEKYPSRYGEIVGKIKDVGNHAAYFSGTSFTLKDLEPQTAVRDAAFKAHEKELSAINQLALQKPELRNHPELIKKKVEVLSKIEAKANEAMKGLLDNPNNTTAWIKSGAKGDPSMGRQMLLMSGLNTDAANRLVPEIARRSFSEGLSPMDHLVHANGARKGVVLTYTAVQAPGAFAKELNTVAADMVITQADCGTGRGRVMPVGDRDVLDRYLAAEVPGIGHRNDLVTPRLVEAAKKKNLATLTVRSPLYCQAHEGVCAHCYGINEEGRLPRVGEHVGLKSAQAITEPLTQLALNNKHAGGVVTAGKTPLEKILQIMHAPKQFAGAATLARASGPVMAIDPAPAGGFNVTVGGIKHYVPPEAELKVKLGQMVARGDSLSSGTAHPAEVVEHKGMEAGRQHFADATRQLYADAGINGHGKIFETISRATLNLGQVMHPGEHQYVPGEVVHWNSVAQHTDNAPTETVPVDQAAGRILAAEAGTFNRYTTLAPKVMNDLKKAGVRQVKVFHQNALVVKPIMLGTERAALHKGDWMANLGFRFLTPTFKENAATGAATSLHSWNPFPAYAHGAEFGKGKDGRY